MFISYLSAFLLASLLVITIPGTSALIHSVFAAGTQINGTEPSGSKMEMDYKNSTAKSDSSDINVTESQSSNFDPFKGTDSSQNMNTSSTLTTEDKPMINKDINQPSTSQHASDSSCAKEGMGDCKGNEKNFQKNTDNSKSDHEKNNKEQKHNSKPDVNAIKDKIKADIKNRFKLPIDIPFP